MLFMPLLWSVVRKPLVAQLLDMSTATAITLLAAVICLNTVGSLNILGIFPYGGKSHFYVFGPYLKELARKGHNVTVISYFPQTSPIKNYHDISLAGSAEILEDVVPLTDYQTLSFFIEDSLSLFEFSRENCKTLLANEQVQSLLKDKRKFDLVVAEQFSSDCPLGLAYKLGSPVVGITSHILMPYHYERIGLPYNPSYMHVQFFGGGTKPSFYQRMERSVVYIYLKLFHKYLGQRTEENILRQYFDDIPPLEDLANDIKFYLLYQHYTLTGSELLPANVKEVGGFHVAKPKRLPEDLKKFIEDSEHGVIYVSFGSMLKAVSTPKDKLESIIGALSELPQRVIWKWEEKTLPGNPKNFYISKWLPQNDILAHSNVLVFYSHAGMLGTTEAFYHGKPVVAMPIFGDQPSNAAALEESGLGVIVEFSELTKETLLEKLKTTLDPEFRQKAKRISQLWHDRPMSAMDTAIYWTEYAARNHNFTFRSSAANVPMYQYYLIDILACLLAFVIIIVMSFKFVISLLCCQSGSANKRKSKRD